MTNKKALISEPCIVKGCDNESQYKTTEWDGYHRCWKEIRLCEKHYTKSIMPKGEKE